MSRANCRYISLGACCALLAAACSQTEGVSVPADGIDRDAEGGERATEAGEQRANGGQSGSGTLSSTSTRPSAGGQTSANVPTHAGGQLVSNPRTSAASGGARSLGSTSALVELPTSGGANTFTRFTGFFSRGGFGSMIGGSNQGSGGATASSRLGLGGLASRTTNGSASPGGSPASGGSSATQAPNASGPVPVLPAIAGTCPTFNSGTVTVAGLSGIALQVGPKRQGTGSLLFYWHGTGSTSSEVNRLIPASVRQEILDQGGVIASFQGSLGTGGDCSGTAIFSKDDFKAADQLAACAVRDHNIDPRRIYTTGCSAGGLQSGCMAALRSSYLAASVPNSGGEVVAQAIQDAEHIPAVMTMHGGASDMVVVSFSQTSATFDKHMDSAGGFVINCDHGGGHCGAPAALYTAAWEFMKAHPFGTKPSPYASALPALFPSYCSLY